jgi:hypothetical protein
VGDAGWRVVTDHVPLMVPLLEEALKAWDANPPAA